MLIPMKEIIILGGGNLYLVGGYQGVPLSK